MPRTSGLQPHLTAVTPPATSTPYASTPRCPCSWCPTEHNAPQPKIKPRCDGLVVFSPRPSPSDTMVLSCIAKLVGRAEDAKGMPSCQWISFLALRLRLACTTGSTIKSTGSQPPDGRKATAQSKNGYLGCDDGRRWIWDGLYPQAVQPLVVCTHQTARGGYRR